MGEWRGTLAGSAARRWLVSVSSVPKDLSIFPFQRGV
jgi:hypothetical protein